jgi:RNA polymerase sigma-70 factor (ECF subfamily)
MASARSKRDQTATDADVVDRVRSGDRSALDALVRVHAADLLAFAYRHVGSRAVAEEIVQDVFFNIWKNHETWHVKGAVSWYLFRAVRNRAYETLKRERVARRWFERQVAGERATVASPDVAVERDEAAAACEAVVQQLPHRVADVVRLRQNDLSHGEIAERLGISVKTVEKRMARARSLLRELLPWLGSRDRS